MNGAKDYGVMMKGASSNSCTFDKIFDIISIQDKKKKKEEIDNLFIERGKIKSDLTFN